MLSQSGEGCQRAELVFRAGLTEHEPSQPPWSGRIEGLEAALRSHWDLLDQPTEQFLSRASELCRRTKGDPSFSEPPSTVCGKDEINCGPWFPQKFAHKLQNIYASLTERIGGVLCGFQSGNSIVPQMVVLLASAGENWEMAVEFRVE